MKIILLILVAAAAATAGSIRLDRPVSVPNTDATLSYDDGTAYWINWSGLYKGVWFHLADFGINSWTTTQSELWFYHHSYYPWDTGSFYCELLSGDGLGPVTDIDQTSLTALHYAPCYASYDSSIPLSSDFWIVANSELSSGGWPSLLGDGSPRTPPRSFTSSEFIVWTPWTNGDFLVRSGWNVALDSETWGAIKTLYTP